MASSYFKMNDILFNYLKTGDGLDSIELLKDGRDLLSMAIIGVKDFDFQDEIDKRVVEVFKKFETNIDRNKKSDYYVQALMEENLYLIIWLCRLKNPKSIQNMIKSILIKNCSTLLVNRTNYWFYNTNIFETLIMNSKYNIKMYNKLLLNCYILTNYELVEILLNRGVDINCCDKYGDTILLKACRHRPVIAKFLISKGADVNLRNQTDCSPLSVATLYHPEIVNMLIEYGAV